MPDYGVTDKGFVLKRMDSILEEVHEDLTEGFGIDTRLSGSSFLNVIVTTFCNQIAELWETAQDSYYAKFPATAVGVNLDNAVEYGGIRRMPNKQTCYPLHCTGKDGTDVRERVVVATNTNPEIRLYSAEEFSISRDSFNKVGIKVASAESSSYTISINGERYSYTSENGTETDILEGLKKTITHPDYKVDIVDGVLEISDTEITRNNNLVLSDNLTTSSVTTIANFLTESYGRVTIPSGIITKIINNIAGFDSVVNRIQPIYGRMEETDIELRQSYIAKSALRSNTMIDSIVAELLNNVPNVETASGYENDGDVPDSRGLPPHSIEIIAEGGDSTAIAEAILKRKAGGIQTYGSVVVNVPGKYGDSIPIRFNRPQILYTWVKVVLHGDRSQMPPNYVQLVTDSIAKDGAQLFAGSNLLIQLLTEGIYDSIAGITYVDIMVASSSDNTYTPAPEDYRSKNIIVTSRQKILVSEKRIEVTFDANSP